MPLSDFKLHIISTIDKCIVGIQELIVNIEDGTRSKLNADINTESKNKDNLNEKVDFSNLKKETTNTKLKEEKKRESDLKEQSKIKTKKKTELEHEIENKNKDLEETRENNLNIQSEVDNLDKGIKNKKSDYEKTSTDFSNLEEKNEETEKETKSNLKFNSTTLSDEQQQQIVEKVMEKNNESKKVSGNDKLQRAETKLALKKAEIATLESSIDSLNLQISQTYDKIDFSQGNTVVDNSTHLKNLADSGKSLKDSCNADKSNTLTNELTKVVSKFNNSSNTSSNGWWSKAKDFGGSALKHADKGIHIASIFANTYSIIQSNKRMDMQDKQIALQAKNREELEKQRNKKLDMKIH